MTNEEAIEILRANYPDACFEQLREAVDVAIEALKAQDAKDAKPMPSQLPSGDTIYRQAAIDAVKKNTFRLTFAEEQNCKGHVAWDAEAVYSEVMEGALLELPSAQSKMVCVANVTLTEEQVQEVFEKAKRSVLSVIESEKTKQLEIIYCRECKHRPTLNENGKPDFPTYRCPCQCGDPYYSWMPEDDWFCGNAGRREE